MADAVDDGYEHSALPRRQQVAVRYADRFLAAGGVDDDTAAMVREEFTADERTELGMAMALFHGISKLLIVLGCEPEQMDVTVMPTPGTR